MTAPEFDHLIFEPGAWHSATAGWPLGARGLYHLLTDAQHGLGGTLPADEELLREFVHATPAEWRELWPLVAPRFPRLKGGGRRNTEYFRFLVAIIPGGV